MTTTKKRLTKEDVLTKKAPYGMTNRLDDWNYGRTTGLIKRNLLRRDMERGVRFLNEQAYSNIWGSTKSSALFCRELRKLLDFSKVYRIDFIHTQRHWYTVRLYWKAGWVVQLKGFSYGYWGEGSRGSQAVLEECGFKLKQIQRLFVHGAEKKPIRMYRRVK